MQQPMVTGVGDSGGLAIRIRFDAIISMCSKKGSFPLDTISAVYVTNRDGCSFAEIPVGANGAISVDFKMEPLQPGVKLTERIKFHYFFRDVKDNMLKPISAGHMPFLDLADHIKNGTAFTAGSNFSTNMVTMQFVSNDTFSRDMHLDLLGLYKSDKIAPSVLADSAKQMKNMRSLCSTVNDGLLQHLNVTETNGGNMFQSTFTAHIMENEGTLYSLYHLDFDGPQNVPPWLCTYSLAETLHHNSVTIEQVMAMDRRALAQFVASYIQAPMRSASAAPYTYDLTASDAPNSTPGAPPSTVLSEVFKRPFSHPYRLLEKGHGSLINDDCEGLATFMRDIANHMGYVFATFADDYKQTDTYVRYNNLMKSYFPKDMFCMSVKYQNKLMDLVMYIGELFANKTFECKITLVSANGAAMCEDGKTPTTHIQAHACASLVCNDPAFPISVMLEGTACTTDDQYSKQLVLGGRSLLLADIANSLSMVPPFNTFFSLDKSMCKIAFHVTHTKGSFYRTAFLENDAMLGSQIGCAPMQFGVDMEYLADDNIKIYMPISGKTLGQGMYDDLKQYISARAAEINLPLVDHNALRANLRWAPMTQFNGCKELQSGRPYTTCLVHVLSELGPALDTLLAKVTGEANTFNESHSNVGVMRAFASMDGVSKVFHIYSDDTTELETCLRPLVKGAETVGV